jgi:hypothetical protein
MLQHAEFSGVKDERSEYPEIHPDIYGDCENLHRPESQSLLALTNQC